MIQSQKMRFVLLTPVYGKMDKAIEQHGFDFGVYSYCKLSYPPVVYNTGVYLKEALVKFLKDK